jgi:hypothetical protein
MTSESISPVELARAVIEGLGIKPGESFKITTTRDGRLILARKLRP